MGSEADIRGRRHEGAVAEGNVAFAPGVGLLPDHADRR